ncbi:MAG: bifunctional diguanylate cyclase/phosphodiesterase [Gammaproteobacteria bacterium]|nr:bifunctional diguanylate cyclase/phosphodiesterase [Gammaproteobacteria bacterium]
MSEFSNNIGNRESLIKELDTFIANHKAKSECFAMLLINIKDFRRFNMKHGFRIADLVLDLFATNLADLIRAQDYVARVGNAEFALLLPAMLNDGHASLAAIKIIEELKKPLIVGEDSFQIRVDIGIALYPQHAGDGENLFNRTESALSDARTSPESYAIFAAEDDTVTRFDWDIEADLQKAIEKNQFELFFQPQVYLSNGQLFGAEALIRWKNGSKGFIRPDLFIPVAEKSGQIYEITRWTLNAALWFRKSWPKELESLNVAVNISTKMLSDPDFADTVRGAVNIYAIEPEQLTLEITESALVEDMSSSFSTLNDLRSLGINISIDDFGTGYSSMAYFKNIPANELKIDQTFIRYMLENSMDQHIVQTIIQMAKGFDLTVVAEGIEDQKTFDMLCEQECDIAQGYHLAKPMPSDAFMEWIEYYTAKKHAVYKSN